MGRKAAAGYRAIVAGNRIEWIDTPPTSGRVEVRVSLLPSRTATPSSGGAVLDALERLARLGGLSSIDDPSAWQREARGDRPLPGRPS